MASMLMVLARSVFTSCNRRARTCDASTQTDILNEEVVQSEPVNPPAPPANPDRNRTTDGSHVYVVWRIRGAPGTTGVHAGGIRAWKALLASIPDGQYHSSTCSLRRASSMQEGIEMYRREAARHRVCADPAVFQH